MPKSDAFFPELQQAKAPRVILQWFMSLEKLKEFAY
jgi:hypothetical protein